MAVQETARKAGASPEPLLYRWNESDQRLPVRTIRAPAGAPRRLFALEAPPWIPSGPANQAFDFCAAIRRLAEDITRRCPELSHVSVDRLLIGVTQARGNRVHGLQARVTPLRFREGQLTRQRHGVTYQVQRYFLGDHEFLYLMTFCLPRFLNQDFDDKFITLFHELFHISPEFNGDLRRHGGRYAIHSHSQRQYDRHMAALARAYLAGQPDPYLHAFLRLNFAQLQNRHGSVVGIMVPRPKLIPMLGPAAAADRD